MTPENEQPENEQTDSVDGDARLNALINRAITSHVSRLEKKLAATLEKTIADSAAKLSQKPVDAPADASAQGNGTPPKADPHVKVLQERLEAFERKAAESEARAKATEEKMRRDAMRAQVREELSALGITGARARAVMHDFEANNTMRFDEETGAAQFAVKRSRAKGAQAEELVFEDIAAGIKDWAKSPDAAEFIPAPAAGNAGAVRAKSAPHVVRKGGEEETPKTLDDGNRGLARAIEMGTFDVTSLID
jgi:hypothetical protein